MDKIRFSAKCKEIHSFFADCKETHSMFRLGACQSYSRSQEAICPRFALLMTPDQWLTGK